MLAAAKRTIYTRENVTSSPGLRIRSAPQIDAVEMRTPGVLSAARFSGTNSDVEQADQNRDGEAAITIVLADDHAVVRSALRLLLEAEPGFEVVSEAGDADSASRYVI